MRMFKLAFNQYSRVLWGMVAACHQRLGNLLGCNSHQKPVDK
ncbi:MAG: hypothetical protein ACXADA_12210 [Candidatus Hodarchaeales archaeon]